MRDSGVRSPPPITQRMLETSNAAISGCAKMAPSMTGASQAQVSFSAAIDCKHPLDVEIAVNIKHPADPQHGDAGQIEGTDMVERAGHQQALVAGQPKRDDVIHAFPVEIIVGVHHAFRPIGGAGGVHQAEQLVRLAAHASAPARGFEKSSVVSAWAASSNRIADGIFLTAPANSASANTSFASGIAGDVFDFVGGKAKIDRQENRAEMTDGKRNFEKSDASSSSSPRRRRPARCRAPRDIPRFFRCVPATRQK